MENRTVSPTHKILCSIDNSISGDPILKGAHPLPAVPLHPGLTGVIGHAPPKTSLPPMVGGGSSGSGEVHAETKGVTLSGQPALVSGGDLSSTTKKTPLPHDTQLDLAPLMRLSKVYATTLTTASAAFNICDPLQLIMASENFGSVLRYTMYFTADLELVIVTTGSPYYSGGAYFSLQPQGYNLYHSVDNRNNPYSGIVDFSMPSEVKITLPWSQATPLRTNSVASTMQLRHIPLVPMVSYNGVTPTVSVSIFARLINIVPIGPTGLAASSEFGGPLSQPLAQASSIAGFFKDVPMLKPYATAAEQALLYGAKGASILGFANPLDGNSKALIDRDVQPGANNVSNAVNLALNPKAQVSPSTPMINLFDEMSFAYLASRYNHVGYTGFSPASSVGSTSQFGITAFRFANQSNTATIPAFGYDLDTIQWLVHPWRYAKVHYTYKVKVFKTRMTTGRMLVWLEPFTSEVLTGFSEARVTTVLWDISQSDEIEIDVPFFGPNQCEEHGTGFNAMLNLKIDTPLRQPGPGSEAIEFHVFRKAKDMWVAEPSFAFFANGETNLSFVNTTTPTWGGTPTLAGWVPTASLMEDTGAMISTTIEQESDTCADKVTSIRYAIKSFQPYRFYSTDACVSVAHGLVPKFPLGGFGADGVAYQNYGDASIFPTLMAYYKTAYLFYKGAVQYGYTTSQPNIGVVSTVLRTGDSSRIGSHANMRWFVGGRPSLLRESATKALTISHPFNSNYPIERIPENNTRVVEHVGLLYSPTGSTFPVNMQVSAGDDFSYCYFIGPPTIYSNTAALGLKPGEGAAQEGEQVAGHTTNF